MTMYLYDDLKRERVVHALTGRVPRDGLLPASEARCQGVAAQS